MMSLSQVCISQFISIPSEGSKYVFSKEYKSFNYNFFDKSDDTWNVNFLKPVYQLESSFTSASGYRIQGRTVSADLVYKSPDGQIYFLVKQNGALYCKTAYINSEWTKSGLMRVDFSPFEPIIYSEKKQAHNFEATVTIQKSEIAPKFDWLYSKANTFKLILNYTVDDVETTNGILEYAGTKNKCLRQITEYKVNYKFYLISSKSTSEYSLNPFLLPGRFKDEVVWNNFKQVKFYVEGYNDAALSFKTNGREVKDLKMQIKGDFKSMDETSREIISYPNPTYGEVFFDLINYPKARYRIEVYNVIGRKIYTKTFGDTSNSDMMVDLTELKKGVYLYSIFDENDKRLTSKRISIVTP
jgi:hypothetical protein